MDEQLKLHVRLKPFMDQILPLVHKRRYVDAFKLISELQQKAGADTPLAVLQLKAEMLLELGVCDAASALIKSACAKQQAGLCGCSSYWITSKVICNPVTAF